MLLHIVTDEKFIDSAWAAFACASPQQNVFVVLNAPKQFRFIHDFAPVRISLFDALSPQFLSSLQDYDAVFLHSLNNDARLIVDAASQGVNFVWIGWGYDYYHLISNRSDRLLPLTSMALKRTGLRSRLLAGKLCLLLQKMINVLMRPTLIPIYLRVARRLRRIKANGIKELDLLNKITFFAPVLEDEYHLIAEKHVNFSLCFASWNYEVDQIFDYLRDSSECSIHKQRIIVGNSATPESNHLDAFAWLAEIGVGGEVACPLSYGSVAYGNAVVKFGRRLFGARFIPITNFMSADDYACFIASSTHLVMNHIRQQGLGNIIIALYAGTRVVMRGDNPIYTFLTRLGFDVVRFSDFDRRHHGPESEATRDRHREILNVYFGRENHLRRTRLFIRQCKLPGCDEPISCEPQVDTAVSGRIF